MCDWLHHPSKLLQARCCCVPIQISQDGFMLRPICMFLGCDMPIQLVLSSEYDDYDRLEDLSSCTDSGHGLQNMQHFTLEQIDLHVFLPVIYQ